MKAYEFQVKLTAAGKLEFPDSVLKKLPIHQELRVIVLINEPTDIEEESEENAAWHNLAAEQFFADYSEEDSIYDEI